MSTDLREEALQVSSTLCIESNDTQPATHKLSLAAVLMT